MKVLEFKNLLVQNQKGALPSVPFLDIKEKVLGKRYNLSISFVDPKTAKSLNKKHRNKSYIPNTLSFSLTNSSGEIILCLDKMKVEYKKFAMSYQNYLVFIIIHSMLHLKGYEHGSTMEEEEQKYLACFIKK